MEASAKQRGKFIIRLCMLSPKCQFFWGYRKIDAESTADMSGPNWLVAPTKAVTLRHLGD